MEEGGEYVLIARSSERFRIMFVIRPTANYICLVGVDYNSCCLFSVMLFCENDKVDLDYNTSHYPKELIAELKQNEDLINSGLFDIKTYEITLFDSLKEKKVLNMSGIRDRGLKKKWQAFKSMPQQYTMLNEIYENDRKISKPDLDEYELDTINDRILHSLESQAPLLLRLYDSGYLKEVDGVVKKVDPFTKTLKLRDSNGSIKQIKFVQIVGCEVI
ncbi:YolD-like family protein [Bacillus sp. ISL-46]|uniref:YolD-like family protein n=1 Tax=Bacillus sp. ISL-46 TaxID=2819129 RepID=UPI001BE76D93|nr:YolD-like family protein [Bacillus sp. ISL-46]MBT2721429.1 YolD-like family protein [Bacillus sp. ISL-46]